MNHENAAFADSANSLDNPSTIGEIIIHKSRFRYLLHSIISVLGLALVIYISVTESSVFTFISVLFFVIFLVFVLFSLKNFLDRTIQIKMDPGSITFKDGTNYRWSEIKHVFIERKNPIEVGRWVSGRNPALDRYYLNIETTFSGLATGYRTAKTVDITGLEYTPDQILRHIKLYQRKYR